MGGLKIREARKAAKMTQEQLSQAIGINRATLSKYESGTIDPPTSQIQAIAAVLGVEPWELMGYDGSIRVATPKYPLPMVTEEQFDRMPPSEREYYTLRLLAETTPDILRKRYVGVYDKLNKFGKATAVQRVQELARLHEYTDAEPSQEAAQEAPQSPPAPQEGESTTPSSDAPTAPPERE